MFASCRTKIIQTNKIVKCYYQHDIGWVFASGAAFIQVLCFKTSESNTHNQIMTTNPWWQNRVGIPGIRWLGTQLRCVVVCIGVQTVDNIVLQLRSTAYTLAVSYLSGYQLSTLWPLRPKARGAGDVDTP